MTDEQQVIEQLSQYRQMKARIQVLSNYSVGAGITVSRLNEEDQLQELHRRLRGRPSYMYLSKRELQLEQTAHAYLGRYPSGIKAQKQAVPIRGFDQEDEKLLLELRGKIQKVIAARGYEVREGIDQIIERLAELQDLRADIDRIDFILTTLESYKPDCAQILRLVHVEGKDLADIREEIRVSKRTFWRKLSEAEREYKFLAR